MLMLRTPEFFWLNQFRILDFMGHIMLYPLVNIQNPTLMVFNGETMVFYGDIMGDNGI